VESTRGHNWRTLGRVLAGMAVAAIALVLWTGTSSAATVPPPPPTPTADLLAFLDQLTGSVTTDVVDPVTGSLGLPPADLSLQPTLEPVIAPVVDPLVNEVVVPTLDGLTGTIGAILPPPPPLPGSPVSPPPVAVPDPTTLVGPAPVLGAPSADRATTTGLGAAPTGAASATIVGSSSSELLRLVRAGGGADQISGGTESDATDTSSPRVPFAPTGSHLPGGLPVSPDLTAGAAGLLLIAVLTAAAALFGPSAGRRLGTTRLLSPRQLAASVATSPD
jgi:hypothetical protein